MKTVHVEQEKVNLKQVIDLARKGPVLLLTPDGREFFVSEADDFEKEVATLRASSAFQRFLDERSACKQRIPLEKIEKEIDRELAKAGRKTRTRKA